MTLFTLSSPSPIDFLESLLLVISSNNSSPFPFEIVLHFPTTPDTNCFAEDNMRRLVGPLASVYLTLGLPSVTQVVLAVVKCSVGVSFVAAWRSCSFSFANSSILCLHLPHILASSHNLNCLRTSWRTSTLVITGTLCSLWSCFLVLLQLSTEHFFLSGWTVFDMQHCGHILEPMALSKSTSLTFSWRKFLSVIRLLHFPSMLVGSSQKKHFSALFPIVVLFASCIKKVVQYFYLAEINILT